MLSTMKEQIDTLASENESLSVLEHLRGSAPYPCHSALVPHPESDDPCHGLAGGLRNLNEALKSSREIGMEKITQMRRDARLRAAEPIDVTYPVSEHMIVHETVYDVV